MTRLAMTGIRRLPAAVALAAATAVSAAGAGPAAAGPAPCLNPDPPRREVSEKPWEHRVLDPRAVWPHSTGAGVVVAVIDSGVDTTHPQLRSDGSVLRGTDLVLDGGLPGTVDCVSHGTAAASIIAADPVAGIGFAGLAPGARILPIRVTERATDLDSGMPSPVDPRALARAIRYAADRGAEVINLSLAGTADNRHVRAAVEDARARDVLIVAAAGNLRPGDTPGATFPAAHPGVLGVGAVGISGVRLDASRTGPHVDLVAPGEAVLGATRAGGHQYWTGTSFATPFVSATAALVRAAWPQLSADEVAERLLATASPAPGGAGSAEYGAGMVNPYRAVVDRLTERAPGTLPPARPTQIDPARMRTLAWWDGVGTNARLTATATGIGTALALLVGIVGVRGRRSAWRPARIALPPAEPAAYAPPEEMFLLQPPAAER